MTNREFAQKNKDFIDSCEAAGVAPTKRQASKYRRGMGSAAKVSRELLAKYRKWRREFDDGEITESWEEWRNEHL